MNRPLSAKVSGPPTDVKFALRKIGREHARILALVGKFIGQARSGAAYSGLLVLLDKIIMLSQSHHQTEDGLLKRMRRSAALSEQRREHSLILHELERFQHRLVGGNDWPNSDYVHLFDSLIAHHLSEEAGSGRAGELAFLSFRGSIDGHMEAVGARNGGRGRRSVGAVRWPSNPEARV